MYFGPSYGPISWRETWEKQPILFCAALYYIKKIGAAWEMLFLFREAKNWSLTTISCSWNVQVRSTVRGLQKTLTLGIWVVFPKKFTTPIPFHLWYYWMMDLNLKGNLSQTMNTLDSKRNVWNHLSHCVYLVTVNTTKICCASCQNFITVYPVRPPLSQNLWWRSSVCYIHHWFNIWCGEANSKNKCSLIHTNWLQTNPS